MTTFRKNKTIQRIACLFVTTSFLSNAILPGYVSAQEIFLPAPTQFVGLSNSYSFPVLKGLKFDPATPFNMQFIIDTADQKDIDKDEASRLIKYFFAGLTIPEQDTWVNMSSYEKDRIIPPSLSETDLGKDLLSLDYILKQVSVSLTYPESEIGKDFWSKTYAAVLNIAHTTNLPINTFNKIWIMPDKAEVYEHGNFALVHEATLKTMLEEDYLALKNNISDIQKQKKGMKDELIEKINKASSNVMREFILPKINKDVNSGKNFATLRQIYYALVLGVWFKKKFKDSIYKYYIDQGKVKGIDINDKGAKDKIYNLYIEGLKKGLYNYIKSDYDPGTRRNIKRQYFSGGFTAMNLASSAIITKVSETTLFSSDNLRGPGRVVEIASLPIGAEKQTIAASPISKQEIANLLENLNSENNRNLSEQLSGNSLGLTRAKEYLRDLVALEKKNLDKGEKKKIRFKIANLVRLIEKEEAAPSAAGSPVSRWLNGDPFYTDNGTVRSMLLELLRDPYTTELIVGIDDSGNTIWPISATAKNIPNIGQKTMVPKQNNSERLTNISAHNFIAWLSNRFLEEFNVVEKDNDGKTRKLIFTRAAGSPTQLQSASPDTKSQSHKVTKSPDKSIFGSSISKSDLYLAIQHHLSIISSSAELRVRREYVVELVYLVERYGDMIPNDVLHEIRKVLNNLLVVDELRENVIEGLNVLSERGEAAGSPMEILAELDNTGHIAKEINIPDEVIAGKKNIVIYEIIPYAEPEEIPIITLGREGVSSYSFGKFNISKEKGAIFANYYSDPSDSESRRLGGDIYIYFNITEASHRKLVLTSKAGKIFRVKSEPAAGSPISKQEIANLLENLNSENNRSLSEQLSGNTLGLARAKEYLRDLATLEKKALEKGEKKKVRFKIANLARLIEKEETAQSLAGSPMSELRVFDFSGYPRSFIRGEKTLNLQNLKNNFLSIVTVYHPNMDSGNTFALDDNNRVYVFEVFKDSIKSNWGDKGIIALQPPKTTKFVSIAAVYHPNIGQTLFALNDKNQISVFDFGGRIQSFRRDKGIINLDAPKGTKFISIAAVYHPNIGKTLFALNDKNQVSVFDFNGRIQSFRRDKGVINLDGPRATRFINISAVYHQNMEKGRILALNDNNQVSVLDLKGDIKSYIGKEGILNLSAPEGTKFSSISAVYHPNITANGRIFLLSKNVQDSAAGSRPSPQNQRSSEGVPSAAEGPEQPKSASPIKFHTQQEAEKWIENNLGWLENGDSRNPYVSNKEIVKKLCASIITNTPQELEIYSPFSNEYTVTYFGINDLPDAGGGELAGSDEVDVIFGIVKAFSKLFRTNLQRWGTDNDMRKWVGRSEAFKLFAHEKEEFGIVGMNNFLNDLRVWWLEKYTDLSTERLKDKKKRDYFEKYFSSAGSPIMARDLKTVVDAAITGLTKDEIRRIFIMPQGYSFTDEITEELLKSGKSILEQLKVLIKGESYASIDDFLTREFQGWSNLHLTHKVLIRELLNKALQENISKQSRAGSPVELWEKSQGIDGQLAQVFNLAEQTLKNDYSMQSYLSGGARRIQEQLKKNLQAVITIILNKKFEIMGNKLPKDINDRVTFIDWLGKGEVIEIVLAGKIPEDKKLILNTVYDYLKAVAGMPGQVRAAGSPMQSRWLSQNPLTPRSGEKIEDVLRQILNDPLTNEIHLAVNVSKHTVRFVNVSSGDILGIRRKNLYSNIEHKYDENVSIIYLVKTFHDNFSITSGGREGSVVKIIAKRESASPINSEGIIKLLKDTINKDNYNDPNRAKVIFSELDKNKATIEEIDTAVEKLNEEYKDNKNASITPTIRKQISALGDYRSLVITSMIIAALERSDLIILIDAAIKARKDELIKSKGPESIASDELVVILSSIGKDEYDRYYAKDESNRSREVFLAWLSFLAGPVLRERREVKPTNEETDEYANSIYSFLIKTKADLGKAGSQVIPRNEAKIRLLEKLQELKKNSGLPILLSPLQLPKVTSDNHLWSESLGVLYFDAPVYRRVESEDKEDDKGNITRKGEITTGDLDDKDNKGSQINELGRKYDVRTGEFKSIRLGSGVKDFLEDKDAPVTLEAYFMHRGVYASKEDILKAFYGDNKLRFDITVIPPAFWGKEYAKTIGHYHFSPDYPEIYQVVSGEVLWLMQKCNIGEAKTDEEIKEALDKGEIEDFIAVRAKAGDIVIMLPGYGHVSVNLSETEPLIMADWLTWHQKSYYGSFEKNRGAAYYVRKNDQGQLELKLNPKYAQPKRIRQMAAKDQISAFGLKRGDPIYNLVKLNDKDFIEKTRFLYHPNDSTYKDFLTPEATLDEVRPEEQIKVASSSLGEAEAVAGSPMAISTEEIKKKLENLQQYMPGEDKIIYEFGKFLSTRLNPTIVPDGFVLTAELAIYDLAKGIDGFTGKPIVGRLAGYPPSLWTIIRLRIPDIIKAVCPAEFSQEVKVLWDEINNGVAGSPMQIAAELKETLNFVKSSLGEVIYDSGIQDNKRKLSYRSAWRVELNYSTHNKATRITLFDKEREPRFHLVYDGRKALEMKIPAIRKNFIQAIEKELPSLAGSPIGAGKTATSTLEVTERFDGLLKTKNFTSEGFIEHGTKVLEFVTEYSKDLSPAQKQRALAYLQDLQGRTHSTIIQNILAIRIRQMQDLVSGKSLTPSIAGSPVKLTLEKFNSIISAAEENLKKKVKESEWKTPTVLDDQRAALDLLQELKQYGLKKVKESISAKSVIDLLTPANSLPYVILVTALKEAEKATAASSAIVTLYPKHEELTEIGFPTAGWRSKFKEYGGIFSKETVYAICQAGVKYMDEKKASFEEKGLDRAVVIAHDTRKHMPEFAREAATIFARNGIKVYLVDGFSPSPMNVLILRKYNASLLINLTASHNGPQYGGFEFFDGRTLGLAHEDINASVTATLAKTEKIEYLEDTNDPSVKENIELIKPPLKEYIQYLKEEAGIDFEAIKQGKPRVVVDLQYGTGVVIKDLVEMLGLKDYFSFIHDEAREDMGGLKDSETLPENLNELSQEVIKQKADGGTSGDTDYDRTGIIYEDGSWENPNLFFTLLGYAYLKELSRNPDFDPKKYVVIRTIPSTAWIDKVARHFGIPDENIREVPVGFRWVNDAINAAKREGKIPVIAFEESGGASVFGSLPYKDGITVGFKFAQIMAQMKQEGKTLSGLKRELEEIIGKIYTARSNPGLEGVDKEIAKEYQGKNGKIMVHFRSVAEPLKNGSEIVLGDTKFIVKTTNFRDGVKIVFEGGEWICVRPSGTEPVFRLYTEAYEEEKRKLLEEWFTKDIKAFEKEAQERTAAKNRSSSSALAKSQFESYVDDEGVAFSRAMTTNAESEIDPSLRDLRMRNDNSEAGAPYGGIDLGNINVGATPNSIPVNMPPIDPATFQGFTFRIIKIEPIINLSSIFGPSEKLADDAKPREQLAYLKE